MENEKLDIYTNTKYSFGREERKNIVLDIKEEITSTEETDIDISKQFNVTLDESVTIDTHSDVFLDSITTFNCKSNKTNEDNMGFILRMQDFEIKTISNSNNLGRSLFIPNENSSTGNDVSKSHKGKKLNHICSINPMTIKNISGSISNMGNKSIFNANTGNTKTYGRCIIELVILSK
tara:strand:+ start:1547 stop:2080 length:534 start_codon:yes stop_codon:yes gene_type:complete